MTIGFYIGFVVGLVAALLFGAWSAGKWILLAKWADRKGNRDA